MGEINTALTKESLIQARQKLAPWEAYIATINKPIYIKFLNAPEKIKCFFTGNQWGKNRNIVKHYITRWIGKHPIESFNLRPDTQIRTYRFCSEKLPNDPDGGDANTIYPVLKQLLPKFLIKKDITQRKSVMTIRDYQGGPDFYVEFVSYGQELQAQAGVQRCIAEGQRVLMHDGVWRNIENLKDGDWLISEAIGGFGPSSRINKIKKVWKSGDKEVYQVKCQKGITFECTDDHLIMIPSVGKSEYKKLKDLKVGDKIKCKMHTNEIESIDCLPEEIVVLTAIILGDGWTTRDQFHFACANENLIIELNKFINSRCDDVKINFCNKTNHEKGQCKNYSITFGGNHRLREFFRENNLLGKKAGDKFVPDVIFRQSSNTIRHFLRFLYATDGWCGNNQIGYCSTSHRLAQDVYLLLRRLGIRSTIIERDMKNENWNKQYWVLISQSYDIINFIENIGIAGKNDRIEKLRIVSEKKLSSRVNAFGGVNRIPRRNKKLKEYVTIKSIIPIGVKPVYDISMETGGWDEIIKNGKKKQRKTARTKRDNFIIQGGVIAHNCSVYIDENCPRSFFEEQLPRLLASDGDIVIGMTPALGQVTWQFEELFENARIIYRTKRVCRRIKERYGEDVPEVQITGNKTDIAVFMAATDDNPYYDQLVKDKNEKERKLAKEGRHPIYKTESEFVPIKKSHYIKEKLGVLDEETEDVRRFGIFRQVSGRIFKDFDTGIHVINDRHYFPDGIPHTWVHGRGIDYHEHVPWHIGFISISPQDEAFFWDEVVMSPEHNVTLQICQAINAKSKDYKFHLNKIDPLAAKTQVNTGLSTIDDLNRIFHEFKREGQGTGGYWSSWDTKSTRGREEVRKRLKNARLCGKPFNNRTTIGGRTVNLPTLWIFPHCRTAIDSMKNWRLEEWQNRNQLETKEMKETPMQRYSHMNMVIECLFKEPYFKARSENFSYNPRNTVGQYGRE